MLVKKSKMVKLTWLLLKILCTGSTENKYGRGEENICLSSENLVTTKFQYTHCKRTKWYLEMFTQCTDISLYTYNWDGRSAILY